MSSDDERDEIKLGPEIAPGVRSALRRDANGEREVAVRPLKEGDPVYGEIAQMDPECRDGWHTVRSVYRSGPAQVATPAYREGHNRIFGKKQKVGLA